MALSFALSCAVLSAVLPVQSSYCASTCAVHVTQPILFFVANAPNHIPGLSRKPMVDPHRSKLVYLYLRYLSAMLATSLPILDHPNSHATYAKKLSAGLLLECAAIHATNGSTRCAWAWTHVSTKVLHQTTSHGNAAAAACPTSLHHSLTLPYRNTLTPFRYSHLARQASPIVELESQLQCHPP